MTLENKEGRQDGALEACNAEAAKHEASEQLNVFDTLAKELDERYFGRELPHKFKFGVTGCQNNCLKAEENDVGIKGGMNIEYKEDDCISCGVCVKACRQDALKMVDGKIELDSPRDLRVSAAPAIAEIRDGWRIRPEQVEEKKRQMRAAFPYPAVNGGSL